MSSFSLTLPLVPFQFSPVPFLTFGSLGKLKVTPQPGHLLHYSATPYIEDIQNTFVDWTNDPDTNAEVTIPELIVACTQEVKNISNDSNFIFKQKTSP